MGWTQCLSSNASPLLFKPSKQCSDSQGFYMHLLSPGFTPGPALSVHLLTGPTAIQEAPARIMIWNAPVSYAHSHMLWAFAGLKGGAKCTD